MIHTEKRRDINRKQTKLPGTTNRRSPTRIRSDKELWEGILAGHQPAWRDLVTRYSSLVYNVCSYLGLSYMDAADCFQQTWLQLYRHRKRIQDVERLSSWLVTTAKRESLKMKERAGRFIDDDCLDETADPGPDPDQELLMLERQHKIEYALSLLDPTSRRILEEFFFADEHRSYRDIADSLGYSENTLGAKRRRCLEKLRLVLLEIGFIEERDQG